MEEAYEQRLQAMRAEYDAQKNAAIKKAADKNKKLMDKFRKHNETLMKSMMKQKKEAIELRDNASLAGLNPCHTDAPAGPHPCRKPPVGVAGPSWESSPAVC